MNFSEVVDNDDDKLCGDGYGRERERERGGGVSRKAKIRCTSFLVFC